MQGNGVWDQYTVKADMILVEVEQDDPHCGIWYADYTGVINPATGIPSEASKQILHLVLPAYRYFHCRA